jgi:hypothetical protein
MFIPPTLLELLWIAILGARGWFIAVALFGSVLFGLSLGLNAEAEPKAVALAFFLPLLLSAITGTVALGSHRARSEAWKGGSLRKPVFLAAFTWNAGLGLAALFVDRVVLHFKLLPREPFAFPESILAVAAMAAVLALLAVYPRQGPQ